MNELIVRQNFIENVNQMNNKNANYALMGLFLERYTNQQTQILTKTGVAYKRELVNLIEALDQIRFDRVDYYTLDAYCKNIQKVYKAVATQIRIITTIRSFFSFLYMIGAVKANVAGMIVLPKTKDNVETPVERVLNESEVESFFKTVRESGSKRDYAFCSILITTGVRIDELCNASWCNIYKDDYQNVGMKVIGKGGKERPVKIRQDVWNLICDYRKSLGLDIAINPKDTTPLLLNYKGGRLTDRYIRKLIGEYAVKAGIDKGEGKNVSPHWFRHTSATFALMGGANVEEVRQQLGHSSLQHTTRYLHNVKGLQETAADHIKVAF